MFLTIFMRNDGGFAGAGIDLADYTDVSDV